MQNVLMLVLSNQGTIAKCSRNLYTALQKSKKFKVQAVLLYRYENGEKEFDNCPFLVDRTICKTNNVPFVKKISWARRVKKEISPDVTISNITVTNCLNVLAGGGEIKYGTFHSPYTQAREFGVLYYILFIFTHLFVLVFLDKWMCVSYEVARYMSRLCWKANKKVDVVYNIHYPEQIKELSLIDAQLNFNLSDGYILYCGRLDDNKAPSRLIDAYLSSNTDKHLVFIGPDPYNMWQDLISKYCSVSRCSNIHYLGPQINPYTYMRRASVLISCSYSEGLPGVIIEALCLGIPVIATNSSEGIWEIFDVHSEYDRELSNLKYTSCGILCPNRSSIKKALYKDDIDCLRRAIESIDTLKVEKFTFLKYITDENVIKSMF